VIEIRGEVLKTSHCKRRVLKDPDVTRDICRKFPKKSQTIQHITGSCRAPAQADDTQHHNQVANVVHQELAIKCGLSEAKPTAHYKYDPQSVWEYSTCKLHYDMSIITDRTVYYFFIVFVFNCMLGIHKYIRETNHVTGVHSVTALLYLQSVLHVVIFRMFNMFCTFTSALPAVCVQCPIWLFSVVT
jgi:hypothetical protein